MKHHILVPVFSMGVVQAKAYLKGNENILLVPDDSIGWRKFVNIPMNRHTGMDKNKYGTAPSKCILVKYNWFHCVILYVF